MPHVTEHTWLHDSLFKYVNRCSDQSYNKKSWCLQNQYKKVKGKSIDCALVSPLKSKLHAHHRILVLSFESLEHPKELVSNLCSLMVGNCVTRYDCPTAFYFN